MTTTSKNNEPLQCCICNGDIDIQFEGTDHQWDEGHNAQPVADGRCCSMCNDSVVIRTRINNFLNRQTKN